VLRQLYSLVLLQYSLSRRFHKVSICCTCLQGCGGDACLEGNGCCMQRVRGVIFASGLQREVFTAGNDIKELYAPQTSIARRVPATMAFHVLASHACYVSGQL
jgi:hypothetical protein